MVPFLDRLAAGELLVGDGAWGTQLMARGLEPGMSPESLNRVRPEVLAEVAGLYLEAGANLITTNSFGGTPLRLAHHDLDEQTDEINRSAITAIKPAVEGRAFVSASVGPTGAIMEPYGETPPELVAKSFARQIGALMAAGPDLICIETMIDLREALAAVEAARAVSTEIPIMATMTFEPSPRGFFTTMGTTIEEACSALVDAGADVVGSNCGNGIDTMIEIAEVFTKHAKAPVAIQSNAGLPVHREGELFYPETPDFVAERVARLMDLGVSIIGGCCGTTPDHIRAIRSAVNGRG